MSREKQSKRNLRQSYDDEFMAEVVQMLLDGHSAQLIVWASPAPGKNDM